MREIRLSGSVEGVAGNRDPYSDRASPAGRLDRPNSHIYLLAGPNAST